MKNIFKPILFSAPMVQAILEGRKTQTRRIVKDKMLQNAAGNDDIEFLILTVSHKIKAGNILWVRETFTEWPKNSFQYFASTAFGEELGKWKPSIHMPKKACRIFLKVRSISIERLREISEYDAISEGIKKTWISNIPAECKYKNYINDGKGSLDPIESFESLWISINGQESYDANPFVWVIEFERIEKPLDFIV
jgi:hypothetical protein